MVIPLASAHYMEVDGIRDAGRRSNLARLMEELSGFVCFMPRSSVMRVELDAALAQLLGTILPFPQCAAPRLGGHSSLRQARRPDLHSRRRETSLLGCGRNGPAGRRRMTLSRAPRTSRSHAIIARTHGRAGGRGDACAGGDPTVARQIAEDRAQGERELGERLVANPEYRDRVRDVVAGRYLAFELVNAFQEACHAHRRVDLVAELTDDIDRARQLTDSMPSADAWISLLTAAHRNPQSRWEPERYLRLRCSERGDPRLRRGSDRQARVQPRERRRLPQVSTKGHPHARPARRGTRRI